MNTDPRTLIRKSLLWLFLFGCLGAFCFGAGNPAVVRAQAGDPTPTPVSTNPYYKSTLVTLADGNSIEKTIIDGPPQPPTGFVRPSVTLPDSPSTLGIVILNVPAYNWTFGCSATSGAMIAAYWDRNGYPNMYTGPTNGGIMPMDSSAWPRWTDASQQSYGQCPLAASHNGLDGRITRGSIDDYWVAFGSSTTDPYITKNWTQHTWGDAIGDYMKTSQSSYENIDGATSFYFWSNTTPLTCSDMASFGLTKDGTYGRKLFYEARGYTVTDCYNQNTDNNGGGFTFAMFKAEIDAGRPVMLNLAGHTVVGIGYDSSSNTVFIHDTWDFLIHSMTWGGVYAGMALQSVSIVNLAPPTYTLSVNRIGTGIGTLASSPVGIDCGSICSYAYGDQTVVTLTATPGVNSIFSGWSGSNCSGTGTCTLTMNAAKSVTAQFTHLNQPPNLPALVRPADNTTGLLLPPTLEVTVSDPEADAMNVTFYGRPAAATTSQDFSIVLIPDTQNETTYYPDIFKSQTAWIANNQIAQNIVFVTHAGDIVNTADSTTEWGNARAAMDNLEAGNIPYSVAPGNHDLGGLFNTFFGYNRFLGKPWYGGYFGNDNDNNFSLFSASGMNFILVNLQYNPTAAMLDWADARLKQYSTRRGIVVSHSILNIDNTFTPEGTAIFAALKDNPNLFLLLCGHMHSSLDGAAYLALSGSGGHTIHIIEADYQEFSNGGNGYLRILRFSPSNGRIYATTYSPFDDTYITTYPDKMDIPYDMTTPATFQVIGSAAGVTSGSHVNVNWTGLANNTSYEWYAVANDGTYDTASSTWSFTSALNSPPATPSGITTTDGQYTDRVSIAWIPSTGATWYEVYRNTTNSTGSAALLGSPASFPFDDTTAVPGTTYWYFVKACNSAGCSTFSSSDSGYRALLAPSGVSASDGDHTDRIDISWNSAAGAAWYQVYRNTSDSPIGASLMASPAAITYMDTLASPGARYWYFVKTCNSIGCSDFSSSDSGYRALAVPGGVNATDGAYTDRVSVTWNATPGATYYEIYHNTTTSLDGAALLATPAASSYADMTGMQDTVYWYFVRACNPTGCSAFSASDDGYRVSDLQPPSAPATVNATDALFTDHVIISWSGTVGAAWYQVYRNTLDIPPEVAPLDGYPAVSPFNDSTGLVNITYWYFVKACNASGCSDFSSSDSGSRTCFPLFLPLIGR